MTTRSQPNNHDFNKAWLANFCPHTLPADEVIRKLAASEYGLSQAEAERRLAISGKNTFPEAGKSGILLVLLNQFRSPLIYVLLVASVISVGIGEHSDAIFIFAVLLLNAIIGGIQEYSAQNAAASLKEFVRGSARVVRDNETVEISADLLVPGDIVLVESGARVPADIRLISNHDLELDESLLTGESINVFKNADTLSSEEAVPGDRLNMLFSGTIVSRGRGRGVVVSTGMRTELGRIASVVLGKRPVKAPLLIRMEKFTHRVALVVVVAALLMALISALRGTPFEEIFLMAVALAVSAIPEGLPVALTVALSIGMRRMAARNVIVRKLVAVESLGSCTYIATDKTGTLTINQLTATDIIFPDNLRLLVTGKSYEPSGEIHASTPTNKEQYRKLLDLICRTAVLANEATLAQKDHGWAYYGDSVDVALLVVAHKTGVVRDANLADFPELAFIPFESEHLFSASLNSVNGQPTAHVKGATEKLIAMCNTMELADGPAPIDVNRINTQMRNLADNGYRVIALAYGPVNWSDKIFTERSLTGLTFIGLVGLIDPLRENVNYAVSQCRQAGIQIAMITGDHPATALAIARELQLAEQADQVVTGPQIKHAMATGNTEHIISNAKVFARVEPQQKLDIVHSLQQAGHFVAVSGDGANDAPAMRTAHVGVAMGKRGTDIARETADIIITDDDFSSIVAGIEEGRISYANVRKVIFLLISTGAAEIVLFTLALIFALPLPLVAVQLLWLNLVTNGIQDIALAFEPAEGDELKHPPRKPDEPIFNRLMVERVIVSALVMGLITFGSYQYFLNNGYSVEEARNAALLLMVLFENIHVFNCRSETRTAFRHNPLRNPFLLFGTACAQLVHIGAMYTPWLSEVLEIQPISLELWLELLLLATSIFVVMEIQKWIYGRSRDTRV